MSYVRDGNLDKGITQFETAVKLQPGYVTAWNNLGDAYDQKKDLKAALKAFEEVLLFDPNNRVARPRVDALRDRVNMYKGVPVKSKDRWSIMFGHMMMETNLNFDMVWIWELVLDMS